MIGIPGALGMNGNVHFNSRVTTAISLLLVPGLTLARPVVSLIGSICRNMRYRLLQEHILTSFIALVLSFKGQCLLSAKPTRWGTCLFIHAVFIPRFIVLNSVRKFIGFREGSLFQPTQSRKTMRLTTHWLRGGRITPFEALGELTMARYAWRTLCF